MRDVPATPASTLQRARTIARRLGMRYVYVGNVHDPDADSTWCPGCGQRVIERDWYELGEWRLRGDGICAHCGTRIAGVFEAQPGRWGSRRMPVSLQQR